MEKALMRKAKDEREKEALYKQIKERISKMDEGLEALYMGSDLYTADLVHGLRKGLGELKGIFFNLLIDEKTVKEILAERMAS
jgi:hypothetical protein